MFRPLLMFIAIALFVNSCLPSTSFTFVNGDHESTVANNVPFTPVNWPETLVADIYQPVTQVPTPAVVLIHGGGWNKSERRGDMVGIAKALAKNGYLVMNTTYRLTPTWTFPAQIDDINQAIKYLRKNSESLNIDPTQIATFGYSAGGHLAALAGLDKKNQISAVVAGGAPTDLTFWPDGQLTGLLLGGPVAGNEKIYAEASPVNHITPDSPPFFLYHGTADKLVPKEHCELLINSLEENHVTHEVYWIKNRSHIMTHLFSAKAIPKAISFLDDHIQTEESKSRSRESIKQ